MKKHALTTLSALAFCSSVSAFAGVTVSSPINGSTVNSNVYFKASASTSCAKGVASMGIYPAPYQLAYVTSGSSLSTTLNLNPGSYGLVVEEWDNCGGAATTRVNITVQSGTGVFVTSPASNSTVSSPAHFVATATTSCSAGVASMGIYPFPARIHRARRQP